MKVSVAIQTYNQEQFIAQTIESVLMQKVNFDYEIIVGEDCSTDKTSEIVLEFQKKYPDKIRPLFSEKNFGDYGKSNFIRILKACKGEYIALLDGDDYWTHDCKLQLQADFLDNHSECSICCHFFHFLDENGKKKMFYAPGLKRIYRLKDLLMTNFIGSSTVMLRNNLFGDFPQWYYESHLVGDWPFHVLNAQYGNIGCIRRFFSIKRENNQGIFSRLDNIQKIKWSMKTRKIANKHLNSQYDKIFKRYYASSYLLLANEYIKIGNRKQARNYVAKAMTAAPLYRSIFSVTFVLVMIKLYFPWSVSFLDALVKPIYRARLKLQFKFKKVFPRSS